jgi:hypothetical protein
MQSVASQLSTEQISNDVRNSIGDFEPNENERLGNEDSAHHVLPGTIPKFGEVVIKPHGKHQRAVQEQRALEAVAAKGFEAIEPLLVVKGGLATYLVTRRIPDLRHLGQLDWDVRATSPRLRSSITPTLNEVSDNLAAYHQGGVVHGDYQVKNAMRLPMGGPIYGDAEKTWINPPKEVMTGFGNKDVALFGASALARGLLEDRPAEYRAQYMESELLTPYLKAVNPDQFAMSPEERQQAIMNYWLAGMNTRGIAPWPGRQMQGYH